jgi:hypothetical protein
MASAERVVAHLGGDGLAALTRRRTIAQALVRCSCSPLRVAPPPDLVEKEADRNPLSVGLGALCIRCASSGARAPPFPKGRRPTLSLHSHAAI